MIFISKGMTLNVIVTCHDISCPRLMGSITFLRLDTSLQSLDKSLQAHECGLAVTASLRLSRRIYP
ncbi:hypothetical protein CHELA40_14435 [Chelatococcus asaccharovorans]|nr:hypothetical protein CHELA17_61184 [Chelatococcus asaccharovorans]CAH1677512.1 hypothetical protein CHELA40_14435 [Chelatococcus asaccharovorans]